MNGGSVFDRVVCGVDRSDAGIAAAQVAGRVAAPVGSLTVVAVGDTSIAVHAGWAMPQVQRELAAATRRRSTKGAPRRSPSTRSKGSSCPATR